MDKVEKCIYAYMYGALGFFVVRVVAAEPATLGLFLVLIMIAGLAG